MNTKEKLKNKYAMLVEEKILETLPELKGKFEALKIWDDIFYSYVYDKSVYEAAQFVINRFENK